MIKNYILLDETAGNLLLKKKDMKNLVKKSFDGEDAYEFDPIQGFPFTGFFIRSIRASSDNVFELLTESRDMLVFYHPKYEETRETFISYEQSDGLFPELTTDRTTYIMTNGAIDSLLALLIQDPFGNFIRYNLIDEDK